MNRDRDQAAHSPRENFLHIATGADGETISLGKTQAEWLVDNNYIKRAAVNDATGVNSYRAITGLTARQLNELVFAQPQLRECDFCRHRPSEWVVKTRRFKLEKGPAPGPVGGDERPIVACDVCARLISENAKSELIDRALTAQIDYARRQGGHLRAVVLSNSDAKLRGVIAPMVREVVFGTFANRRGYPERA